MSMRFLSKNWPCFM